MIKSHVCTADKIFVAEDTKAMLPKSTWMKKTVKDSYSTERPAIEALSISSTFVIVSHLAAPITNERAGGM